MDTWRLGHQQRYDQLLGPLLLYQNVLCADSSHIFCKRDQPFAAVKRNPRASLEQRRQRANPEMHQEVVFPYFRARCCGVDLSSTTTWMARKLDLREHRLFGAMGIIIFADIRVGTLHQTRDLFIQQRKQLVTHASLCQKSI